MKVIMRVSAAIAAASAMGLVAISAWPIDKPVSSIELEGEALRGAYLARASGCIACHTNFDEGGEPLAGGVPLKTPFGTLFSPNITPDTVHGIGDWHIEDFARAIRQGVSPNGDAYYPAFTYPFYGNFTDQDIADLWAAFQTVAPAAKPDRDHDLPFPIDRRWSLKPWRLAFLEKPRTAPVVGNSPLWNRGRELVEGATHCGACHTGRNFLGARDYDTKHFQGNSQLPGGNKSPPIDTETLAMRGWSLANLSYALKTGLKPDGDAFGGGMGEVVMQGTRFLTDADRLAIATYLLDDHAADTPKVND
jgi:mono/diheme cytochrome c family protein